MERSEWCVNPVKFDRAVRELTQSNQPVTDDAIKAIYVRMGGLLLENASEYVQEVAKEKKSKKSK